jgi:hypothetical protein
VILGGLSLQNVYLRMRLPVNTDETLSSLYHYRRRSARDHRSRGFAFRSNTATQSHPIDPATPSTVAYVGAPGAEPPHVRGASNEAAASGAAVMLEEFGDFNARHAACCIQT